MITLREIWIYPVKSLPGVRLDEAKIDDRGLVGDRRFMLVDGAGEFTTQRTHPELALLRAELDDDRLRLSRPDGARLELGVECAGGAVEVTVWGQTVRAIDAGDEAAAFFGNHVGADVRLVRMPASTRRPADPDHAGPDDLVAFQDGFPFLLAAEESLALLNARLEEPVDMRRFRPNFVIGGAEAFEEDRWSRLLLGGLAFSVKKACARCSMVDVDPDRGVGVRRGGKAVQAELAKFRKVGNEIFFGQNLLLDTPSPSPRAVVRVGQALEVEE